MHSFFGMATFILGGFFYIVSYNRIESKNILPDEVIKLAREERLIEKEVKSDQLVFLEKIFEENKKNIEKKNLLSVSELEGYFLRKEIQKRFVLQSTSDWYKNDRDFHYETYFLVKPRNYFLKNVEYTLKISHRKDKRKINFFIQKQCCSNRLMAVANQWKWLEVQ